jgi:predicted permease
MRQLSFAFRTLFRTPFVTTIAVLSLALGIGANAAIFSMFDQIMLRALPVPEPDRLVNLSVPGPKPGSQSCGQAGDCEVVFSYAMFRDLERQQTVFTGLAAHNEFGASLSYEDAPMTGEGMYVSGSYFPTLGLRPAVGRLFTPDDDKTIGGDFVVVLSYGFWEQHFGSDRQVIGKTLKVNSQSMTIIGVAPQGFRGTTIGILPLVYVPIDMRGVVSPGFRGFDNRRSYWIYVFGRLKPGVSMAQAGAAINALYHPIITDVEAPLQKGMSEQTLARFKAKSVEVTPGWRGQSNMQREAKTPLWMLFCVTAIVLLIACANIANLLLARGASRAMEMGVRLALGASRGRLVTQLLVESLLLAGLGGIASLLVAQWTLHGIAALLPPDATNTLQFTLQPAVLVFAAALALTTGIALGMFPAWHNTRADLVTTIRSNAGQIAGARSAARFRSSLVTIQISLATSLLIAAGLFMRSLVNVTHVDLGIRADSVVTFYIAPQRAGYDSVRTPLLYARVEEALGALPGVTGVTSAMVALLANNNWGNSVYVQGYPTGPDVDRDSRYNEIGPAYFSTLGVHLLGGREFTTADHLGASQVAVVNQTFAKKFNIGQDAVGKFISTSTADSLNIQIIGVIPDIKYSEVKLPVPPVFYTPWRQDSRPGGMNFYVRSPQPETVMRAIRGAMKAIDPALPVEDLKTMPQQIRENVFLDRMISTMSASFAVLATLLAAIGLYGVLAYTVTQRTREIGVRMALGADAARVRGMVLGQVLRMMLIGGGIGLVAAVGLGHAASSLLFGLQGHDPLVFGLSIVALSMVALGAGYIPARRASQVDPVQALRYE